MGWLWEDSRFAVSPRVVICFWTLDSKKQAVEKPFSFILDPSLFFASRSQYYSFNDRLLL